MAERGAPSPPPSAAVREGGAKDAQRRDKLVVQGLTKRYGSFVALAETDLSIPEGEFLTLLGPSGSGKTTLLMLVAGLTQADGGRIWINDRDATHTPPYERDIGMVFQNYALFPHLTVAENIAFPLKMRGMPSADIARAVERMLDAVRLPHVAARLPRALSGGQQQRIALARCMVYEPSIILMDEPLGALDKKLRDQMQLEIKQLHGRMGITILYVTHDQEEAMVMSDRICLMNNARIEQLGTPADLYFRPRSVFAANFLGESNLFDAEVVAIAGDCVELRSPVSPLPLKVARGGAPEPAKGPVKVMVRPESLRLTDGRTESCNAIAGEVRDVILVGGMTKYFVGLADGTTVSVSTLTSGAPDLRLKGRTVDLGWAPEHAVVIPV